MNTIKSFESPTASAGIGNKSARLKSGVSFVLIGLVVSGALFLYYKALMAMPPEYPQFALDHLFWVRVLDPSGNPIAGVGIFDDDRAVTKAVKNGARLPSHESTDENGYCMIVNTEETVGITITKKGFSPKLYTRAFNIRKDPHKTKETAVVMNLTQVPSAASGE